MEWKLISASVLSLFVKARGGIQSEGDVESWGEKGESRLFCPEEAGREGCWPRWGLAWDRSRNTWVNTDVGGRVQRGWGQALLGACWEGEAVLLAVSSSGNQEVPPSALGE